MSKSKARKLAEFLRNLTDDAKINTSAVQQDNVVTSRLDLESKANDTEALVTAASVTSYVSSELGEYVHSTHDIPLTFTGDVTGSGVITDMGATSFNLTLDAETLPSQIGHSGKFLTTNGTAASWASLSITNWDTAYGWGNHATQNYAVTTGDTFTGKITASGGIDGLTLSNGITGSNFNITGVNQLTINDPGEGINFHDRVTLFVIDDATDNKINFNGATEVQVNGRRVFESNYHPNADTWTTARTHTVTLAGDVTGSASQSVDGSGNRTWTINTSVANNSHNHHRSDLSDLGVALPSSIITFDQADNFLSNGPNKDSISYNWLNGFKSTHGGYLHSYLVNDHRTQKWYVNWFDTNTGNSGTWASLWHSENFNPSDYLLTSSYTNTTYAINAQDVSGGKAIRLTGSDGSTDDVTFAAGSNVTLTRSGDTITIASTDTNTDTNTTDWYVANSAGTNQFKVDKNEKVRFEGSGATSVSFDAATNKVTINSTDTNTETTTTLTKVGNELRYVNEAGTTQTIDLSLYLDDTNLARILSGTMNSSGIATFTRDDGTSFTVDMSVLLDDTNLSRIVSASWNTSNGVLTLTRNDSTTVSVDLDNRYLTSYTETDTLQSVTSRGRTTTNNIRFTQDEGGIEWERNTDRASIKFYNDSDGDTNSRLEFNIADNTNEDFRFTYTTGTTITELLRMRPDGGNNGITFRGHTMWHAGNFNPSNYLTSYTETDTLQSVTSRGATTDRDILISKDTATLNIRGAVNSANGAYLRLTESGYQGAFIKYEADANRLYIGTKSNTTQDLSSEVTAISINRGSNSITVPGTVTATNFVGSINYSQITNPPVIDNSVDYINAASFNTSTGVLTLSGVGRAGATVDLDGRYAASNHVHNYMPIQNSTPYRVMSATDWGDFNLGNGTMLQASSVGLPSGGTHGYWFVTGKRDVQEGYVGLYFNHYGSAQGMWIGKNTDGNAAPVWERVFSDSYHPNADKWTTARNNNINLTGDVSGYGSASVDGTGNWTVSVSTTVANDSHNHTYFEVSGISDLNSIPNVSSTRFRPFVSNFQAANRSGSNYNGGFEIGTQASSYSSQFVFQASGQTTAPRFRNKVGGTWGSWYALWSTADFNISDYDTRIVSDSRYVKVTGDTMTGSLTVPGVLKITETGTAQHLLIGNQDSAGANKPAMIRGVNGQLQLGHGNSWSGEGGTMTVGLTVDNGRIGIGTSTPASKLHLQNVNSGSWNDGLIIDDPSGWAATIYRRSNAAKMFQGLYTGSDNFIWMSPVYSNSGTTISAPRSDAILQALPGTNTLEFYLPTYFGQNVGMGTTNPGAPLHVYRSVGYTASTDLLRLEGYTPDFGTTPASVNLLFKFQDSNNATNEARIKMATVNDTDYGDNDEAASNLIFETTNGGVASDKMIITGRGYIGMGTNNPKAPLHVTGNIKSGTTNGGANSTITAPLDRFIEIGVQDGSGAGQAANYTSGSGIVFHHGGTSTSALQHLQPDLNTAIFRFVSDRTNTRIEINNGNTRLHQGSGNSLEVTTNSGWLQLGPQNTGFCHLQSNRAFYFNKRIVVDEGIVDSYNEDLVLRRATSSAHQIRIAAGTTTISQNTVIEGNLTVNGSIAQADGFGTLYTFNTTQGLSTSWADVTAIAGNAIPTGTYAIQIFINNSDVGGNSWSEYYSGTMSWYASGTNDNDSNEIPLHNAGHAQNGPLVYARTLRRGQSTMILQLAASGTIASDAIQIKLRRLI